MPSAVRDNQQLHRFELDADGHLAFSEYQRADNTITFMHTEVPKELEGRGIGSALVRGALEIAKSQGLTVKARCPFVAAYIKKHPELT
jgi:predicted GNAT family acetyltransferase